MPNKTTNNKIPDGFELYRALQGHTDVIHRLAWSPDGRMLASLSADTTIRIWDAETGNLCQMLEGHSGLIYDVTWSPAGQMLASTSLDQTTRLWNIKNGKVIQRLELFPFWVTSLAWSPNGGRLALGASDNSVRLWTWDPKTKDWPQKLRKTLEGHSKPVHSVAWSPDGKTLASGSGDNSIRLWDVKMKKTRQVLVGHLDEVNDILWSQDGQVLVSASSDSTVRLWDAKAGRLEITLEGHTSSVTCTSFSCDGRLLASKSIDGIIRLWRCDSWDSVITFSPPTLDINVRASHPALAFHPRASKLATLGENNKTVWIWELNFDTLLGVVPAAPSIHYINAKVVLVGESGVGKSGMGIRIAENQFHATESTHGARFWQIPIPREVFGQVDSLSNTRVELTLWDFAGQAEYRLVHQLFLDDTNLALLLFDCSDPADPFRGVPYWAKVLKKHVPAHSPRFLVSSRCDVSPVTVDQKEINRFLTQHELDRHFRTSAKTDEGVRELMRHVLHNIPWDKLPRTTTPRLFQAIREFLLERKGADDTLVSMHEIKHEVRRRYMEREVTQAEIDTVVSLLQARGWVHRVEPRPRLALVLLKPELINQYASSIIQAARNHPHGIGVISERDVLIANLPFTGFQRLGPRKEKTVLESTVEMLIGHDLCFRQMGLLVFPSRINVTRPVFIGEHLPYEITYRFSGSVEAIYASLVVRLSYTNHFQREDQWKYTVEFSRGGERLGFNMQQVEEGTGELGIYFRPGVSEFDRVTFIHFITDHLHNKGIDIQEHFRLHCPHCRKEVKNREAIEARVQAGKLDIPCQYCTTSVIIPRSIEERYRSDHTYVEKQHELAERVEERTKQEVEKFKADRQQYIKRERDNVIHILHLSDIHLETRGEARKYRAQLHADLQYGLKINHLEYLFLSGDVVNHSTEKEYEAAFELIDGLVSLFGLNPDRVVIVPGNHDLNWDLSSKAYIYVPKHKAPDPLTDKHIPAGDAGALIQDEDLYRQRFANFNTHFYKKVYGGHQTYPPDYAEQSRLFLHPKDRLLFLALNSAWQIDHHYRQRSGINMDALSHALDQLADGNYDDWLKIAVWHHPVTGREMMNDEFMQLLAVHGFQICMHGHIHEAAEGFYKYDPRRSMHIIGAGTFGTPLREQAGIPLQYNLLTLDTKTHTLTVETRKKEKPDGAWSADARWGDKNDPKPRYEIEVKWGGVR